MTNIENRIKKFKIGVSKINEGHQGLFSEGSSVKFNGTVKQILWSIDG